MISSIINNTINTKATVSSRRVGEFVFDAILSESHTSQLTITENPIESGALVADHAALKPKEITISGVIVEYVSPEISDMQLIPGVRDAVNFVDNIIYSSSIVKKSREALAKINQALDTFAPVIQSARALAPWILGNGNSGNFSLLTSTALSNDRISELHEKLLEIQKSGEFLDVQTGTKLYKNMLIAEVGLLQEKDGSATVNLVLKEVIVVESKQVSGVQSGNSGTAGKTAGRTANQSAPMTEKGRTQAQPTSEEKRESLAHKTVGKLF